MDTLVKEAAEQFKESVDAESDNRKEALDDARFVWLGEQWPEEVKKERERQKRPCLTINRMPSFVRQVVNDSRQNRPSIKVSGVDSKADPKTAEVLQGLIRHVERNSNADVAYDTAVEWAVTTGLGYFTIGTEYASDTGFEQEITIDRVVYPFSIYGDCSSEKADSSDWKYGFQIITGEREAFEKKYKTKELVSWQDGGTGDAIEDDSDDIRLARYWRVKEEQRTLVLLSNGAAIDESELTPDMLAAMQAAQIGVVEGRSRQIMVPRVTCHTLSGDAELEDPMPWAGRYIPIVPVYGAEFWIDGKRVLKSLIRDGKDPQRMVNYWRTATTELVALAPKAPWVGPKGFMKSSPAKWRTANTENHAALEYDEVSSGARPQRETFAGIPAGALQEALNASDDIKTVLGMYDASLGARSNETSGRAIMARQREGDVNSFHFQDNLVRAIRHAGRIILDLIPAIYDTPRMVRILGEDGTAKTVQLNEQYPTQDEDGNPIIALHDVTVGRYDLAVSAGPSYTTMRQEAATQMTEMIRAAPDLMPVVGDLLVKNLDWPGAEEISKRLEKMVPGNQQAGPPPEQIQQIMQQVQQGQQAVAQGQQEIEQGKAELQKMAADLKVQQANLKTQEANIQTQSAQLQAELANAKADLQGREMQLHQQGMEVDQRGQMLESNAQANGSQAAAQIVQEALSAVSKQIADLGGTLSKQGQQPIIVPIPQGGRRRSVMSIDKKTGQRIIETDDVMDDDGIGQA